MLPAPAAVVSILSLQFFRSGTSMTQENNKTRKREEKNNKKNKLQMQEARVLQEENVLL